MRLSLTKHLFFKKIPLTLYKKTVLTLGCVVAAMILIAAAAWTGHLRAERAISEALTVRYWESRIASIGPDEAYQEMIRLFSDRGAQSSPHIEHIVGHMFGRALFSQTGTSSLQTCDYHFASACTHGFMMSYFENRGSTNIETMGKICNTEPQCLHGIGHALIDQYDNDPTYLDSAIEACTKLPKHDQWAGCWSGVFAAYNLYAHDSGESYTPQTLKHAQQQVEADPLAPCNKLSQGSYVCYYWQPLVWNNSWGQEISDMELAKRMGNLCMTLKEKDRKYCVAGIGAISPVVANYDPDKNAALCNVISTDFRDLVLCLGFSARVTSARISKQMGAKLCDGLDRKAQVACLKDMENDDAAPTWFNEKLP